MTSISIIFLAGLMMLQYLEQWWIPTELSVYSLSCWQKVMCVLRYQLVYPDMTGEEDSLLVRIIQ